MAIKVTNFLYNLCPTVYIMENIPDRKQYFEQYLNSLSTTIGFRTREHYMYRFILFDRLIQNMGKDTRMDFIVGKFIQEHSGMDASGKSILNPLNKAFLHHYFKCFQLPAPNIPRATIKTEVDETKFLTNDQIGHIIDNTTPRTSLAALLFFETGLRRGEFINIKIDKIDLENKHIIGIGKGDKRFDVIFSNVSKEQIENWIVICENREYPFKYDKNLKHPAHKLWRDMKKECAEIGIENVTPHRFRHSLGRYLRVEKKQDLEVIRGILRHSKLETTKIYTKSTKEERENIIKKEIFGED